LDEEQDSPVTVSKDCLLVLLQAGWEAWADDPDEDVGPLMRGVIRDLYAQIETGDWRTESAGVTALAKLLAGVTPENAHPEMT
jgi:hypothetical protein